jgi:NAD(P)-dependent dehydrogenase (short-subunit alcohol dehydrogenase family)
MESIMQELRFDGQVAIVTGAGGGLGAAHARLLAERGARVVVNDYGGTTHGTGASTAPADEVVAQIRADGGEAVASYDSVINAAAGLAIVRTALDAFGRIDIVVANAGISGGGKFGEIPSESVERMVDTHLIGAFNVVQPAWTHMTAQGYGRVVLTTSGSVFGTASAPYVSAKAGVFGLARSLSSEGRSRDIKVNAIMPVAYSRMTAQIPDDGFRTWIERHFPPHKVSALVALLAHRDAPCTGETFSVGGGRAARVVLGVGPGWHTPDPSPEAFLSHFDDVMSIEPLQLPRSGEQEVTHYGAAVGEPLGSKGFGTH